MAATLTKPPQLRVTRHGYDPNDVHTLLDSARTRLVALAERLRRSEAANVALVAEVRRWKRRAREAEAPREAFELAMQTAEETAAATVTESQTTADQMIERARCESDHLLMRARVEARRAQANERREFRVRAAQVESDRKWADLEKRVLADERAQLDEERESWREHLAWTGLRMVAMALEHRPALPAAGQTTPPVPVVESTEPTPSAVAARPMVIDLRADPAGDRVFSEFMSPDIADEPSREWAIEDLDD